MHKKKKTLSHKKKIIKVYIKAATGGVLLKKGVLKNFAIFIGKHLCWSLFFIKFLCLSEADQRLLKIEAAKFLQPEEISFELLYNLHYINKFLFRSPSFISPSNHVNIHFKDIFSVMAKCDIEVRGSLVYQYMMNQLQSQN